MCPAGSIWPSSLDNAPSRPAGGGDDFIPRRLRDRYGSDRALRAFSAWASFGLYKFEARLAEEAGWRAGDRVLVPGSALGRETAGLAARGLRSVGVDNAWPLVRGMESLSGPGGARGRALQADARRLPFRDGAFDGVAAFNFLNTQLRRSDRREVLREWRRVLKSGGRVALWDWRRGGDLRRLARWAGLGPRRWAFLTVRRFPVAAHPGGAVWGHVLLGPEGKNRPFRRRDLVWLEARWAARALARALLSALAAAGLVPFLWRWRDPRSDVNIYVWHVRTPGHAFREEEIAALFREAGFRVLSGGQVPFESPEDPLRGMYVKIVAEAT